MYQIRNIALSLIFISFILINETRGQNLLQGEVKSVNGEPIPFVTITTKNIKTLTDLHGKYRLDQKNYSIRDSIIFSCVGFDSATVSVNTLLSDAHVTLIQKSFILNEVIISSGKKADIVKLGNDGSNLFNKLLSRVNDQYALFIENSGKNYGIIKTVNYFVKEPPGGSHEGPFRIRIYSVNQSSGTGPGNDLLHDNLIVKASRKNKWFSIDVSKYQIEMPTGGVFIAMEILPADQYEFAKTGSVGKYYKNNIRMPCLGLNNLFDKNYSWVKNDMSNGSRNWREFNQGAKQPTNFMINIDVEL